MPTEKKSAMPRSLKWAVAGAGGFVALAVIGYLVLLGREHHGHHPEYGDVGTWLGTVAAWLAAAGAAVAAYFAFGQLRELRGQAKLQAEALDRQAEQLVAEGEARRKQAALMDEQLEQARAANRALVRQQAEHVDFHTSAWKVPTGSFDNSGQEILAEAQHLLRVANNSSRPIRNVSCWLLNDVTGVQELASHVGEYTSGSRLGPRIVRRPGSSVEVIRAGQEYGFIFVRLYSSLPVQAAVTFTDDAGAVWRIHQDLHLEMVGETPGAS